MKRHGFHQLKPVVNLSGISNVQLNHDETFNLLRLYGVKGGVLMDAKELRIFLGKVMTTLNDEIDNIADDELVDTLEQLVLNIKDAHNYIRLNFEEE